MDIEYMKTRTGFTNDSDFIDKGFLINNLAVGIPYLIIVTGATVYGCVGNAMVIGAVTMYKVSLGGIHNSLGWFEGFDHEGSCVQSVSKETLI